MRRPRNHCARFGCNHNPLSPPSFVSSPFFLSLFQEIHRMEERGEDIKAAEIKLKQATEMKDTAEQEARQSYVEAENFKQKVVKVCHDELDSASFFDFLSHCTVS